MALKLSVLLRNARANQFTALIGAGAHLTLYSGTRPSTPDTATNGNVMLAQLALSNPPAGAASSGVLVFNQVTTENQALATGVATWFSVQDTNGNRVFDGDVGSVGGSGDILLNSTAIVQNGPVVINSYSIAEAP